MEKDNTKQEELQQAEVMQGCFKSRLGEVYNCFIHFSWKPLVYCFLSLFCRKRETKQIKKKGMFCFTKKSVHVSVSDVHKPWKSI